MNLAEKDFNLKKNTHIILIVQIFRHINRGRKKEMKMITRDNDKGDDAPKTIVVECDF